MRTNNTGLLINMIIDHFEKLLEIIQTNHRYIILIYHTRSWEILFVIAKENFFFSFFGIYQK